MDQQSGRGLCCRSADFNMLSEYPGKITVKIDGLAASAASVIAMAGTEGMDESGKHDDDP